MSKRIVILASFIVLSIFQTFAQVGREFWFVAPEVTSSHGDNPVLFRFTTFDQKANIVISMPANNGFTPISLSINANTQDFREINKNTIENRPSNQVNNKGILITSDVDITVYYEVANSVNPDKFTLKGDNGLGTEFFIPSQNLYRNQPYTPIANEKADVVATEDNTTIRIVPTVAVTGHSANIPYTVTLNRGQSYSIEYSGTNYNQAMAGTSISSDKPIAITISDDSINEPGVGPHDLIGDQLIPTSVIGTEYIAVKPYGQAEPYWDRRNGKWVDVSPVNKLFILAIEDGTVFYVDNDVTKPVSLNKGDLIDLDIVNSAIYLNANKPVYAYQLASFPNGNGNEIGSAILPPIACTGSKKVSFTRTFKERFYIQLLTQGRNRSCFVLRDQNNQVMTDLNAMTWVLVPGTNQGNVDEAWYSVSMPLTMPTGVPYSLENTNGLFHMGILDENDGSTSYGYFSSYGSLNVEGLTRACVGNAILLETVEPMKVYKWYSEFSNNQILSTDPSITVSESGKYWVTAEVEFGGCEQTDTVEVEFIRPEFDLGPDQVLCPGEEVEIPLPGGLGTYTWYDGSSNIINKVVVGPGDDLDVWVEVKDDSEYSCIHRDTVNIKALEQPPIDIPVKYQDVCIGDTIWNQTTLDRYEWKVNGVKLNEGDTLQYIIASVPGTYEMTGWSDEGCTASQSIDVTVHALPDINLSDVIGCYGLPHTFSGPAGMTSYEWSVGATLFTNANLELTKPTENFKLRVVDTNGCENQADLSFTWYNETPFSVTDAPTEVCENSDLIIQSSPGFNSYAWSLQRNDGNQSTLTVAAPGHEYRVTSADPLVDAGKYIIEAQDANNCLMKDSVEIQVYDTPDLALGGDQQICDGGNVVITANDAFVTYDWSYDGDAAYSETTSSITIDKAGQYNLLATLLNGCQTEETINLTVNALPQFELKGDLTECRDETEDYSALSYVGSGIQSYLWHNNMTTTSITVSQPEEVWLEITDVNGCKNKATTQYDWHVFKLFDVTNDTSVCRGLEVNIVANDGFENYKWSIKQDGKPLTTIDSNFGNNKLLINAATVVDHQGQYIVEATDKNGCRDVSDYMNLTVMEAPNLNLNPSGNLCEGDVIELQGDHRFVDFLWTRDDDVLWSSADPQVVVSNDDIYYLTAKWSNGCTANGSIDVVKIDAPSVTLGPLNKVCPGPDQSFQLPIINFNEAEASRPFEKFEWTFGDNIYTGTNENQLIEVADGGAGNYSLKVFDSYGCWATEEATIEEYVLDPIPLDPNLQYCADEANFALESPLALGIDVETYQWFQVAENGVEQAHTANLPFDFPSSGDYKLKVKYSGTGCVDSTMTAVAKKDTMAIHFGPDPMVCAGESATVSSQERFLLYEWSNSSGTVVSNAPTYVTSIAGEYFLRGALPNGCFSTGSLEVNVTPLPSVQLPGDNSYCEGYLPTLKLESFSAASGLPAASFEWQNTVDGTILSTADSIVIQEPGIYSVVAMDDRGCENTDAITISQFPSYPVNIGDDVSICSNETLTLSCPVLSPNPYFSYNWYKKDSGLSNLLLASNTTCEVSEAGVYQIRVTDVNGCQSNDEIEVSILAIPEFDLGPEQFMCMNDTIKLKSDASFKHYQWNGNPVLNSPEYEVTSSGTYQLAVWNTDGCMASDAVQVTAYDLPLVSLDSPDPKCTGEKTILTAPSGFSRIMWSTGEDSEEIEVDTGTFELTVFDTNGCSATTDVSVNWYPIPKVELGDDEYICPVDRVQIDAGGGFEVYKWHNGLADQIITANFADTVNVVQVQDRNGCWGWDSKLVKAFPEPTYDLGEDEIACAPETVQLDAGDGYLAYKWNDVDGAQVNEVDQAGEYWVDVFDGCHWMRDTVAVAIHESPVIAQLDTMIYGQIMVHSEGGTEPYQYALNGDTPQDDNFFNGLANGNYLVEVFDANNCMAQAAASIFAIVDLDIPDILTPNHDGINDTWNIKGLERFPNSMIRIYDRYGKLLIEYPATDPGWDGQYLNQPVSSDAYWYVIEIIPVNKVLKGHITLKR